MIKREAARTRYHADPEYRARKIAALSTPEERERRRLVKYGITPEEYAEMLAAQGGHCAGCPATDRLVVDHDHETGRKRAILCSPCNLVLGLVHDDADVLRRLAAILTP